MYLSKQTLPTHDHTAGSPSEYSEPWTFFFSALQRNPSLFSRLSFRGKQGSPQQGNIAAPTTPRPSFVGSRTATDSVAAVAGGLLDPLPTRAEERSSPSGCRACSSSRRAYLMRWRENGSGVSIRIAKPAGGHQLEKAKRKKKKQETKERTWNGGEELLVDKVTRLGILCSGGHHHARGGCQHCPRPWAEQGPRTFCNSATTSAVVYSP
jgi:hypothetical protein